MKTELWAFFIEEKLQRGVNRAHRDRRNLKETGHRVIRKTCPRPQEAAYCML